MATNEFTPRVRRVASSDPGNLLYANSLIRARRYDEARQELEKILQADEDSLPATFAAGVVCQFQRDYEASLEYFNKAISLDPMRPRPSLLAGYSYVMLEDTDQAEAMFRNALALDANQAPAHTALARVLRRKGETEEAAAHLNEALRLDPQLAEARMMLARLYRGEGEMDAAITELNNLLRVNPGHVAGSVLLAMIHSERDEHDKAAQLLETAGRYRPDAARVWNLLGRARLRMEDYQGAEKAYREYVRLRPDQNAGTLGLVAAIIPQRKLDEATELLKAVSRRGPQAAMVHRLYGDIFAARSMAQEAAQSYRATLLNMAGGSELLAEVGDPAPTDPNPNWEELVERYRGAIEKLTEDIRRRMADRDWQAVYERMEPRIMDWIARAAGAQRAAERSGG